MTDSHGPYKHNNYKDNMQCRIEKSGYGYTAPEYTIQIEENGRSKNPAPAICESKNSLALVFGMALKTQEH